MKAQAIIALALMVTLNSRGGELTNDTYPILKTLDGTAYTNAEISSVTPAYVIIFYDGGGGKIPLTNLPPDLQKKYHYNPVAAAAVERVEAAKKAAAQAKARDAQLAAIMAQTEEKKDKVYRVVDGELVPITKFISLYGEVLQVLTDGILLEKRFKAELVFVKCPVVDLTDGQDWQGYAYHTGTHKYEAVSGASKTIPAYDTGLSYLTKSDKVLIALPRNPQ